MPDPGGGMVDAAREKAVGILQRISDRAEGRQPERGAGADPGVLVADGDSWFDCPGTDVLEELEDAYGYRIESVAHRGDTAESMAYGPEQLDRLAKRLLRVKRRGEQPRAILLSVGGNDIAGDAFATLLNHRGSGLPVVNRDVLRGLVDVRLGTALRFLVRTITHLCDAVYQPEARIPILIHGYDFAIPDGRGFRGGWEPLPGPWLLPAFERKSYPYLGENSVVVRYLVDHLNSLLAALAREPGLEHLSHVDLRGTLSAELAGNRYRQDWDNELHPQNAGFARVAARIHEAILLA